jgi:hypothetical protein
MRSRTGLYVMLIFGLFLAAVSMAAKFYLDADSWVAADVVPIEGTVRVSTPPPCPCGCRCPQCPLDACPRCGVAGGYGAAPIAPPWPVARPVPARTVATVRPTVHLWDTMRLPSGPRGTGV